MDTGKTRREPGLLPGQLVKKVFLTSWWTGEQAPPPLPPKDSDIDTMSGPLFLHLCCSGVAEIGLNAPNAALDYRKSASSKYYMRESRKQGLLTNRSKEPLVYS